MALRGLLRRKIQERRQMNPEMRKIYRDAFRAEQRKISKKSHELQVAKVRERARADARARSIPKTQRFLRGAAKTYKAVGKKLDKFDEKKFEAWVLEGAGGKKKKR